MDVLKSYIKVAIRTLRRHSAYFALNITGLSLGMACCILIGLYVFEELSYDQFVPDADKVFRIALDVNVQELETETAFTPRPLVPTFISEFPEVESATRLWTDPSGDMVIRYGEHAFPEGRVFFGDSSFFNVFGFDLLQGDPQLALKEPWSIVLTESVAEKYFGDTDPVGEVIHLREPSDRDIFEYTVTGVMVDVPANSHLDFDFLASFSTQRQSQSQNWLALGVYSYVKLSDPGEAGRFEDKLPDLFRTHSSTQLIETFGASAAEFEAAGNSYAYFLQPLTDIHLHSQLDNEIKPTNDIRIVYVFILIALFVLIVACVNFINLSTALAPRRSAEIGVRKTMGSHRVQLIFQFLTESVLLSLLSICIAVVLVGMVLPYFRIISGSALVLDGSVLKVLGPVLLGLSILVGCIAGAYPAAYLSGFQPLAALKGGKSSKGPGLLRNTLVVFQFSIATMLIACTAIVYSQMHFMASKNLGYTTDQVVYLEGAEVLGQQAELFREQVRALPGVEFVTNSEQVPGRSMRQATFKIQGEPGDRSLLLDYTYISYDFVETFGMNLVQGRSLSRAYSTDSLAVLLNESAVKQLGIEEPIGRQLEWPGESVYTIVGVVEDFHAASLHHEIGPLALIGPDPRNTNRPNLMVSARLQGGDIEQTMQAIEGIWNQFAPDAPFVHSFLDTSLAQLYENEQKMSRLIMLFTLLALTIACLGLFGLAAYMAEQRTKEMGVRKVLGASAWSIVLLLTWDFSKLIVLSILIASPIAFIMMNSWLQSFAFAIELGIGMFIWSGMIALSIALAAISYQAIKTARTDPVHALRYE